MGCVVCGEPVVERPAARFGDERMHLACLPRFREGMDAALAAHSARLREYLSAPR